MHCTPPGGAIHRDDTFNMVALLGTHGERTRASLSASEPAAHTGSCRVSACVPASAAPVLAQTGPPGLPAGGQPAQPAATCSLPATPAGSSLTTPSFPQGPRQSTCQEKGSQASAQAPGTAMPSFPTLTCILQWGSVGEHSPVARGDGSAGNSRQHQASGPWGSDSVGPDSRIEGRPWSWGTPALPEHQPLRPRLRYGNRPWG